MLPCLLTTSGQMHLTVSMSRNASNLSRGYRFLSVWALLLLLAATTVQAAHFCGIGSGTAAIQGTTSDESGDSATSPCAICLASHQTSNVVTPIALQSAVDLGAHVVLVPIATAAKGETLFISVRPPPAS